MLLKESSSLGEKYRNVVNPDQIGVVEGDGITSPDVFGIDVGDSNVPRMLLAFVNLHLVSFFPLDNDIAGTADNSQTLALDYTAGTRSNECLVRGDSDTEYTGIVTGVSSVSRLVDFYRQDVLCHRDRRRIRFVVGTPVILVNSKLARRSSTPGGTPSRSSGAFSTGKIEAVC